MSKSVEETRRKLFESKFPPDEGVEWNPHKGRYEAFTFFNRNLQCSCDWQNDMLEAFNAALDAVEIKLPDSCKMSTEELDEGYNAGHLKWEILDSIESLNLGIKITT